MIPASTVQVRSAGLCETIEFNFPIFKAMSYLEGAPPTVRRVPPPMGITPCHSAELSSSLDESSKAFAGCSIATEGSMPSTLTLMSL